MSARQCVHLFTGCMFLVLAFGCARTEPIEPTMESTGIPSTPQSTATSDVTPTPVSTSVVTPEPNPTPTTITIPTVTPEPTETPVAEEAVASPVTEGACCGLFNWIDDQRLLVFDAPPEGARGARIVDISGDDRILISPGYGLASPSGIVALLEPGTGDLVFRDELGEVVSTIPTNGVAGWPSPDGSAVAWLQPLPISTPSSSVNRVVRLQIADIATGSSRPLFDMHAAELAWMPDSRRLIGIAREPGAGSPGIWLIDSSTGDSEILFEDTFLRSLQLAPDGGSVAVMRLFNSEPSENGLWVFDIDSGDGRKLFDSGSYRWASDSEHVWRLEMGATGRQNDQLALIRIASGEVVENVELDGQVLNEQWEIAPDGRSVAFWRLEDDLVVLQTLR